MAKPHLKIVVSSVRIRMFYESENNDVVDFLTSTFPTRKNDIRSYPVDPKIAYSINACERAWSHQLVEFLFPEEPGAVTDDFINHFVQAIIAPLHQKPLPEEDWLKFCIQHLPQRHYVTVFSSNDLTTSEVLDCVKAFIAHTETIRKQYHVNSVDQIDIHQESITQASYVGLGIFQPAKPPVLGSSSLTLDH